MKRKPIRIDWDQLESAFENSDAELIHYLDLVTGRVCLEGEDEDDDAEDELSHGRSAAVSVSPGQDSTRAYISPLTAAKKVEWMRSYVDEAVDVDPRVLDELRAALGDADPAAALSQVPEYAVNTRLMFTAFTSGWLLMTQSSPDITWALLEAAPEASSTRTATIFASGATPTGALPPRPVMMPATLVPCPCWSSAAPAPLCDVLPFGQQPEPSALVQ